MEKAGDGLERLVKGLVFKCIEKPWLHNPVRRLTMTGRVPDRLWLKIPARGVVDIILPDGSSLKYEASANDFLDKCYFYRGLQEYEPETFPVFFRLATQARLVMDIGAHSGMFTLIACAANPRTRVIAFEPIPYIHERLLRNIELNGWGDRCSLIGKAASDKDGTASLRISPRREIHASLSDSWKVGSGEIQIDVSLAAVDDVCENHDRVDLVKLDVEGHEDKVLLGMGRIISESRPDFVIECTPDGPYINVQEILDIYNYRYFHVTETGLQRRASIIPDTKEVERNYLCCVRDNPFS